ncbi:DUF2306 domain-containing protein [Bacillus sp. FJAT-42376]|uniref:DUF2306 domain-containing protein n=1 Tax=Bacillus sp. FJAT-42376 TaxID=2014076 RepID=UPI000F4E81A5|nr:DUF2306 domain-containing protein [Bacillus sp. FJAT-42376]AZB41502.1 DUF2306 domain-containing protein [Bacillus sp. FJAT-42376]
MFSGILMIHIAAGFICLVTGLGAMLSPKRNGKHSWFGEVYHGSFVVIFLSSITMAVLHWEESAYLFYIGFFSYSFAVIGYAAVKKKWKNWLRYHISGMLGSYIAVITAVLVVNAPKIAFLQSIPALWIWFIPTIIGSPLIALTNVKYRTKKPSAAG